MATPAYLRGIVPRQLDQSALGVGGTGVSAGPTYDFPAYDPRDTQSLLRALISRQERTVFLLEPDNIRQQYAETPTTQNPGQVYRYPIPKWTRHWKLRNFSTGAGAKGTLYFWHEEGTQPGAKASGANTLPRNYDYLLGGDSFSDNSILGDNLYVEWDNTVATSGTAGPNMSLNFEGRV